MKTWPKDHNQQDHSKTLWSTLYGVSVYRNRILPPTVQTDASRVPHQESPMTAPATTLTSWHINDRLPNNIRYHPLHAPHSNETHPRNAQNSSKTKRSSSAPSNIHPRRREQEEACGGWAHNRPSPLPQPCSRNDDAHACMLPIAPIAPTSSPAAPHRLLTPQPSM
jgi:hypothetical protein